MRGHEAGHDARPRLRLLCQAAPLAGPFFDGELPEAEAGWFRDHLLGCGVCREELRAIRRLSHLLGVGPGPGRWPTGVEDAAEARARRAGSLLCPRPAETGLRGAVSLPRLAPLRPAPAMMGGMIDDH